MHDFEMPPESPVSDVFDARFTSGRILEAYSPANHDNLTFPIDIKAANGPVTVSWSIVNSSSKHFILTDGSNGKYVKPRDLASNGSMKVATSGNLQLLLKVSGGANLPKQFALGQNYPNPFNPSTHFNVELPKAAFLNVTVYNVLGQKVATLVDEVRNAGTYTITWDGRAQTGTDVSTGLYFIRMSAEKFTAVQKVMLMK